jgi:hypothetical protein
MPVIASDGLPNPDDRCCINITAGQVLAVRGHMASGLAVGRTAGVVAPGQLFVQPLRLTHQHCIDIVPVVQPRTLPGGEAVKTPRIKRAGVATCSEMGKKSNLLQFCPGNYGGGVQNPDTYA